MTKVKTAEEIQPAIRKAMNESPEVMIEAFMAGNGDYLWMLQDKDQRSRVPYYRGSVKE